MSWAYRRKSCTLGKTSNYLGSPNILTDLTRNVTLYLWDLLPHAWAARYYLNRNQYSGLDGNEYRLCKRNLRVTSRNVLLPAGILFFIIGIPLRPLTSIIFKPDSNFYWVQFKKLGHFMELSSSVLAMVPFGNFPSAACLHFKYALLRASSLEFCGPCYHPRQVIDGRLLSSNMLHWGPPRLGCVYWRLSNYCITVLPCYLFNCHDCCTCFIWRHADVRER